MNLPMEFAGWVIDYLGQNPHLSIAIAFSISMGEALLIVGLFVPSTVVLVSAGTLVGAGKLDFWPIFVATTIGAIVGDAVSYWAGRFYGNQLKRMWPLSRYPQLVGKSEAFFAVHGGKSVAIGRFVPGVKAMIPGIAGMMGMSQLRFLTINVVSAFLWAGTHLIPGVLMGKGLAVANQVSGRFAIVLFGLIACIFIAAWMIRVLVLWVIPVLISVQRRFVDYAAARPQPVWQWFAETLSPHNPRALRVVTLSAVLATSVIGFASLLEDLIGQDSLVYVDLSVANLLQSVRNAPADRILVALTMAGDGVVLLTVAFVIVGWLLWRRAWTIASAAALSMLSAALFAPFIRIVLQQARPLEANGAAYFYTFPSSHATLASVVFGILAVLAGLGVGRWGKALIFACAGSLIVAIALSRIYLGAHWPSDVAAGLLFGVSMTAAFALTLEATRPEKVAPLGLAVVAVLAYGAVTVFHIDRGHAAAMEIYNAPERLQVVTLDLWRTAEWRQQPARRIELTGETGEPFIAQWAGTPASLRSLLEKNGWTSVPTWSWIDVLNYADSRNDIDVLLPRPSLHEGRLAKVSATSPAPDSEGGRLVLRAWQVDTVVTRADKRLPLLLVSLTVERKKELPIVALPDDKPAPAEDVSEVIAVLRAGGHVVRARDAPKSDLRAPLLVVGDAPAG